MALALRRGTAQGLHNVGHADVSVADLDATAAADAGHRQLALDEIVGQLPEEPPVPAIVGGLPRVEAARHPGEAPEGAGVPYPQALVVGGAHLALGDGEAGAGRAHVAAAAALQAAVPDLLPGSLADQLPGDVADGRRVPARGDLEALANVGQ